MAKQYRDCDAEMSKLQYQGAAAREVHTEWVTVMDRLNEACYGREYMEQVRAERVRREAAAERALKPRGIERSR
jgi:hypothetical protein